MEDGQRYREAAERARASRPDVAGDLDRRAAAADEEASHADHTTHVEYGATVCSCGKTLGLSTWAPDDWLEAPIRDPRLPRNAGGAVIFGDPISAYPSVFDA